MKLTIIFIVGFLAGVAAMRFIFPSFAKSDEKIAQTLEISGAVDALRNFMESHPEFKRKYVGSILASRYSDGDYYFILVDSKEPNSPDTVAKPILIKIDSMHNAVITVWGDDVFGRTFSYPAK